MAAFRNFTTEMVRISSFTKIFQRMGFPTIEQFSANTTQHGRTGTNLNAQQINR